MWIWLHHSLSVCFIISSLPLSCSTLCDPVDCSMPGFPVLHQFLKLAQTYVHRVGDAIQSSYPLSPLLLLPSIFPSIRVFSKESVLHISWPKYWHFSLASVLPLRMDWFDLLAVQGTFKSLLQHHSSKASIFRHSAFFMVQLSHLYMTTGKTIALTIWAFVSKVMSLPF